ncbi:ATPase, F1 complex, gamma subunit domain-containing protein [Blyttiomyces helicus]|uniref:ATP synthase subunit gamma n=1 Tax=Blyttiomyces helicus TaxID=388810 RepID=A0A4P9W7B2_9FUNG|nr:ATPase, F1 complex, gamma subunit domain-containing protein [Blyttiomyces helicus]|eukprot:RKO88244.1 ATPase, F1 complex, gamma subunit domain-containing protein [Blyttiomyces helicus]
MKMIASTKVTKAQRNMENARVFGSSAVSIFKHAETETSTGPKPLIVVISSDRGLCGGIHTSVSKNAKHYLAEKPEGSLAIIGLKARAQLQRENRASIAITFDQVAKNVPTWNEASLIASSILESGIKFDGIHIIYNKFKSVIQFDTSTLDLPTEETFAASPKISAYETEEPALKSFDEFTLANSIYWTLSEGYASEMAAKRTAMENATKNADEMIQKLTLTYNRSRQATITNELIDIIVGASAM